MIRKVIFSENPEKALWWRLGQFKNVDRVTEVVQDRHNKRENAKKQAVQIRYCLEQAEEYYRAAEVVSVETKPLLLYYGMASLAWALILFKNTGDYSLDRIPSAHQEHGLTRPRLNYRDRTLPLAGILDAIRTTCTAISIQPSGTELRGSFGLLYKVARNEPFGMKYVQQSHGVTESDVRLLSVVNTGPGLSETTSLSLGRLLLEIPDMVPIFGELEIRPPFAYCSDAMIVREDGDTHRLMVLTSRCTDEEIAQLRARFPEREGATMSSVTSGINFMLRFREGEVWRIPRMSETIDGRLYIYIPEEDQLPEPSAFLGAMFLLGMLVRYYPHIWMQLLERRHPLVDVVEAFLPIAQRKYPNLILNNLTGDSFLFKVGGAR